MNNKNITINDLQSLLRRLKSSSYFFSDLNVTNDLNGDEMLLSREATKAKLEELESMIEDRISDIDDSATSGTTETYSIDKILSLLATKENNIFKGSTMPSDLESRSGDIWFKDNYTLENDLYYNIFFYRQNEWRSISTDWTKVINKPFSNLDTNIFSVNQNTLSINEESLMKTSIYVENGNVKKSNESIKITGVEEVENSYVYGKDKNGNIGFIPIEDEIAEHIVTFVDEETVELEKNKLVSMLTL